MHSHSKHSQSMKIGLAMVLAAALVATGCTAQWLSVALADLPVLTQMALNVAALAATLESGKQLSTAESAAIQSISTEAGKDLTLLQTLYNQYKANPDSSTLQKIDNVIGDLNQNLPALLQAAHVSDATLSARITAAVNLILTTVNSFAQLIPHTATAVSARTMSAVTKLPRGKDLKQQWNQQVCGPGKNHGLSGALEVCVLR
jgi:hypothetical protein